MNMVECINKASVPIEMDSDSGCYTIDDLQTILNLNRRTIIKLLEKNEFRWFKIGTAYRISRQSFNHWLNDMV